MYEYHNVKKEAEEKRGKIRKLCNGIGTENAIFIAIIIASVILQIISKD